MRYQTVFHAGTGGGTGVVNFDDLKLFAKPRVAISTLVTGGIIRLSFLTQGATTYEVLYKNDLNDANWQLLTTVNRDGTIHTVTDPIGTAKRFYVVNTL